MKWNEQLNISKIIDGILEEFLKYCKSTLSPDITVVFNCIIYQKDCPELWQKG